MILLTMVFVVAAAIWGLGIYLGAPRSQRFALIGVLYAVVLLVQLVLPETNTLRVATGGRIEPWLAVGAAVAVIWVYRLGLGQLRRRAVSGAQGGDGGDVANERSGGGVRAGQGAAFGEAELSRYARHIILREIGGAGQKRLRNAKVLVVGAGGLGSPALMYLAAAGVGTLGVIDDDVVEGSNLQRQIIHTDARIGMAKVRSAVEALAALNPFIALRPYERRLTEEIATELFAQYDLILDGSDNFQTRYLVNAAAVAAGRPLVAAAITQWEGQIGLYDPARGGPCYECVFPVAPAPGLAPDCAAAGVVAPLPGVLGAMMAVEAIKVITGAGTGLRGRLLIYDALDAETRGILTAPRPGCRVCGVQAGA